jgi:hypothetical protein
MTTVFSTDSREHAKHLAMIHYLADHLELPEPEVSRIYEQEFGKLNGQAKVKDFLLLLVERRVRESFQSRQAA